ncbi:helix-loop-helix DNA-binding superfamily protein [Klebsormidium nitens]|uniref:Helix-loop-helix DNA-binding superfamily protein n=1 Tax=Klebsormidium nitens TaxID=105231 RepID=A0A1Y1HZI8_KLENI|nr:helix-loop-helix DNA-binding superfamily protein [Klebsormidium nitens]|eukprot:GAQ84074.1 helix-loop-helix DNA-binding superfamily protein [Klebsormidium nitens]
MQDTAGDMFMGAWMDPSLMTPEPLLTGDQNAACQWQWPAFEKTEESGQSEKGPSCKKSGSRKRQRGEQSVAAADKADRERERRNRLHAKFMELSQLLDPGRPPKTDKSTILTDAVRVIGQLRNEAEQLKESNTQLRSSIKDLKVEKNELREEKVRLKNDKDRLDLQVKTMMPPSFGLPQAAMAAAFAAQQQHKLQAPGQAAMGNFGMWQFLPPQVLDTSQDHVLRPPAA